MRLLVVEDEEDLQEALCFGLRKRGFAVDAIGNGADAAIQCEVCDYDLVVLDLNLPGLDGLEVLSRIQELGKPTKVIVLSARSSLADKVAGLDRGAHDYLAKPFHFDELEARIRALLRRSFTQTQAVLTKGSLGLDVNAKTVRYNTRPVDLSMREFSVLEYLMVHQGRPVSAEELLEHVWDSETDPFTSQVKVYISTIRRKLAEAGAAPVIRSIRGAGYIIDHEDV